MLGNGDPDLESTVVYGAAITPPLVIWLGHELDGWYLDEGFTSAYTFTTMPAENLMLYASWTPEQGIVYRAEYYQENLGGGFTLYEIEYPLLIDEDFAVKPYVGFTHDSSLDTTLTTTSSSGGTRLTLKLFYLRNSYQLTFDANGGTGGSSEMVLYGSALYAPDVRLEGYTLTDWDPAIDAFMPAYDVTYIAQWAYTIEASWLTTGGGDGIGTLAAAMMACATDGGGTISLLDDFTVHEGLVIPGHTLIEGNSNTPTSLIRSEEHTSELQ